MSKISKNKGVVSPLPLREGVVPSLTLGDFMTRAIVLDPSMAWYVIMGQRTLKANDNRSIK